MASFSYKSVMYLCMYICAVMCVLFLYTPVNKYFSFVANIRWHYYGRNESESLMIQYNEGFLNLNAF